MNNFKCVYYYIYSYETNRYKLYEGEGQTPEISRIFGLKKRVLCIGNIATNFSLFNRKYTDCNSNLLLYKVYLFKIKFIENNSLLQIMN